MLYVRENHVHKLVNLFTFLLLILVYMTFLPFIEGRKRKNSTHVQILMVTCINTCKVAIYIYIYIKRWVQVTLGVTSQELHFFWICIRSKGEKNTHSHVFIVPQKLVTKSLILLIKNRKMKNSINSLLSIIIFIFSPSLTCS